LLFFGVWQKKRNVPITRETAPPNTTAAGIMNQMNIVVPLAMAMTINRLNLANIEDSDTRPV
jgi:hypothetical protein